MWSGHPRDMGYRPAGAGAGGSGGVHLRGGTRHAWHMGDGSAAVHDGKDAAAVGDGRGERRGGRR